MTAKKPHPKHDEVEKHHDDAEGLSHSIKGGVSHIRVKFVAGLCVGPCPVPEVKAGDLLLWLACSDGHVGNSGNPAFFEPVVTVDGELQQRAALGVHSFDAIFLRGI